MDQLEDAGESPPLLAIGDVARPPPSKAPGPICADDARRRVVPALHTSNGHYARQLPKVKGGGKGGVSKASGKNSKIGKAACAATAKKVESGAGGAGGTASKADKVKSGDGGAGDTASKADKVKSGDVAIAGDTWDKYRSRAFKRAAKEAIAKGMSPETASKYRSRACQAAKIDWGAMLEKH